MPGVLQPGQSVTVDITLTVNNNAPLGALVNMAEIFGAKDENGNPIDDVDSTPDTNPNNDPTVDDEINNNGGDEDDHDPATITLEVFDLALIKTLAPGRAGPWFSVAILPFRIKVFNQGTVPSHNIEITDYIPTQLTLNDNDWTNNGNGTASIVLTDVLAPGAQTFVDITFTINPGVTGEVKNLAEISNTPPMIMEIHKTITTQHQTIIRMMTHLVETILPTTATVTKTTATRILYSIRV